MLASIFEISKLPKNSNHHQGNEEKNPQSNLTQPFSFHRSYNRLWTLEEDKKLIYVAENLKRNKWKYASTILHKKTPLQCFMRYKRINPKLIKGKWSKNEDEQIKSLIDLFGKSWKTIAKVMKNRSNRQIRNRYEDYLNENLNNGIFSHNEDMILIDMFSKFPNDWKKIKESLPYRTTKKIRSRVKYLIAKKLIIFSNKQNEKKKLINDKNGKKINDPSTSYVYSCNDDNVTKEKSNNDKNECLLSTSNKTKNILNKDDNSTTSFESSQNYLQNKMTEENSQKKLDNVINLKDVKYNLESTKNLNILEIVEFDYSFPKQIKFSIRNKQERINKTERNINIKIFNYSPIKSRLIKKSNLCEDFHNEKYNTNEKVNEIFKIEKNKKDVKTTPKIITLRNITLKI